MFEKTSETADRRIRRSVRLIKDSFLALAREMHAEHITVTDVCKRADINRGTFYAHFENMEALLSDLDEDSATIILESFSLYSVDKNPGSAVDAILDSVCENHDLFLFHFRGRGLGGDLSPIENRIKKSVLPVWMNSSSITTEQAGLLFLFIAGGSARLIKAWADSDFTIDAAVIKDVLQNVIEYGIYHYLRAK